MPSWRRSETTGLAEEAACGCGALAAEGVQSLLLEGGPTIAASFLAARLVDRLLVFVAPVIAGGGVPMLGELPGPLDLGEPEVERVGDDVLLRWRLREA